MNRIFISFLILILMVGNCLPSGLNIVNPLIRKKLILDKISTAPGCSYNLRRVNSQYTGPIVNCRRTTDSVARDIYYNSDGTVCQYDLNIFNSGRSNCTVDVWYDQSGNNRHQYQSVAADQPGIYTNGTINTLKGTPALLFNGSSDYFQSNDFNTNNPGVQYTFMLKSNQGLTFNYLGSGWGSGGSLTMLVEGSTGTGYPSFRSSQNYNNNALCSLSAVNSGGTNTINYPYTSYVACFLGNTTLSQFSTTYNTVYINSIVFGQPGAPSANTLPTYVGLTNSLAVGIRSTNGAGGYWTGYMIDNICWPVVLNPSDVENLGLNQFKYAGILTGQ